MVHIKEVKEIEDFVKAAPVSLDIILAGGVLCDQRADNGEDSQQNQNKNGKLQGTKKNRRGLKRFLFLCRWAYPLVHS